MISFFANRFHPLLHIVHLLHHDICIPKVIFELQVRLYDEIDGEVIPIVLVFALQKTKICLSSNEFPIYLLKYLVDSFEQKQPTLDARERAIHVYLYGI